ncbi:MAG TPA: hypothetical protein VEY30_06505, partial [Myxococcaceae bacterium]|nr:hypothetical protein [Myxococcaceae bacterium]
RALWEVGRLLSDERLREALFVDLTWLTASTRGGTEQVNASTQVHYFTVAPAYLFRFDGEGRWGAYLQLGGGAAYVRSRFNYGGGTTRIGTVAPLLQYGGGFRVRLGLNDSGTARLMLRLEVTRFRRDYLNDTYLGLGLGAAL